MKKLTGIRENIDSIADAAKPGSFLELSKEEQDYLLRRNFKKDIIKERSVYEGNFDLMDETNVHWLCVDLNKNMREAHISLSLIAHAMRLNLDDVNKQKRETLEDIIEFTDDLAQHIRREHERNIDKMREFPGLREYGKGMKL